MRGQEIDGMHSVGISPRVDLMPDAGLETV